MEADRVVACFVAGFAAGSAAAALVGAVAGLLAGLLAGAVAGGRSAVFGAERSPFSDSGVGFCSADVDVGICATAQPDPSAGRS